MAQAPNDQPHQANPQIEGTRIPPTAQKRRRRLGALRSLLPAIIVIIFGLVILRNEVPAVDDWIQRTLNEEQWRAADACRQAALKLAAQPDFARIVRRGEVQQTQAGYYVRRVVIGHMGEQGREQRFEVHCYADAQGNIVSAKIQSSEAASSARPKPGFDD